MKGFMRNDIPAHTEDPVTDEVISKYGVRVHTPEEADVALVFVESPACNAYSTEDVANGGNGYLPITLQYRPYTAVNAREVSIAAAISARISRTAVTAAKRTLPIMNATSITF